MLTAIGETGSNVGSNVKKPFVNLVGSGGTGEESGYERSGGHEQGQTLKNTSEKLGDAKQREELLDNITDNITEGGSEHEGSQSA